MRARSVQTLRHVVHVGFAVVILSYVALSVVDAQMRSPRRPWLQPDCSNGQIRICHFWRAPLQVPLEKVDHQRP
jgi:hypothetical protein